MSSHWYNRGLLGVLQGTINLGTDNIKVMLVNQTYLFDQDHAFADVPSLYEISGAGYVAGFGNSGRQTLASKVFSVDNTLDLATFDAADLNWPAITAGTIGMAILLKEIIDNSASPLIAAVDFPDWVTNGTLFQLRWDPLGILRLKYT